MSKNANNEVESFIKHGATLERVVEGLHTKDKYFTTKDHLLIVAGSNDISLKKFPTMKTNLNANDRWTVVKSSRIKITLP